MAKQKKTKGKEKVKLLIIVLIALAVGIALVVIGKSNELTLMSVLGGMIALAAVITFFGGRAEINRSFCKKCGTQYDYGSDISWEETGREQEEKRVVATVDITCTCPNCGKERTFTKKFTVAYYSKEKGWKYRNLETMVRACFLKK